MGTHINRHVFPQAPSPTMTSLRRISAMLITHEQAVSGRSLCVIKGRYKVGESTRTTCEVVCVGVVMLWRKVGDGKMMLRVDHQLTFDEASAGARLIA